MYHIKVILLNRLSYLRLTAELHRRATDSGSVFSTINTSNGKEGLEDTTKTLTGKQARGDGEHVHVVALGIALEPEVVESGASSHGDGVVGLGHDEGETDGVLYEGRYLVKLRDFSMRVSATHPVGDPVPVLPGDEEVLDDDRKDADEAEGDGGVSRALGDGELRGSDGESDGGPGSDGGGTIGTGGTILIRVPG